MSARPDLTPGQGRKYQLKQILFQANPERFSLPGRRARRRHRPRPRGDLRPAQGVDMKIVPASARGRGKEWFSTTYM